MYYVEEKNEPSIMKVSLSTSIPAFSDFQEPSLVIDSSGIKKNAQGERPLEDLFKKANPFDREGLAVKFSGLETDDEILEFANTYGLLGVKHTHPDALKYDYYYLSHFEYEKNTIMESLSIWRWHIAHVKKLIKLYKALRDDRNLENLLYVAEESDLLPPPALLNVIESRDNAVAALIAQRDAVLSQLSAGSNMHKNEKKPQERYYWEDDKKPTLISFDEKDGLNLKVPATLILQFHINKFLKDGIFIDFSSVKKNQNSPLGFSFVDRKSTHHLLAVIYYDLFKLINNIGNVGVCDQCNKTFLPKHKDAKFCGKTCQKRHQRADKQKSLGA